MSLAPPCACAEASALDAVRPRAGRSLIDRLDPRTRVILALAFSLAVVVTQSLAALGLALAFALVLAVLARLPPAVTCRRLLALEGFMLVVLALLPFTVPGETIAQPLGLAASAEGLRQAAAIALRANGVAVAAMALLGAMDVVALGRALGRLGASAKLVQLFLFTVRYIELLEREYRRLRLAMRARAFRPAAGPHCWTSIGYLFGMLMVRSMERAERIDAAMRCRGFSGHFPSLDEDRPERPGALDWGFGAAATVLLAMVTGMGA